MFRQILLYTTSKEHEQTIDQGVKRNALAEQAATNAKPKVYRLNSVRHPKEENKHSDLASASEELLFEEEMEEKEQPPNKNKIDIIEDKSGVRFFALGCQGSAKEAQMQVAALMDMLAANPTIPPPDFILILGDNFYDWGVDKPDDPMFEKYFHSIYANPKYEHLKKIPCFVILGNHDENLHKLSAVVAEKGVARGMHQVAHSYLPGENYATTLAKQNLYKSHTNEKEIDLNLDTLPAWNMPSRVYSLVCRNTQIFCIDSNTYASDYLKLCAGDQDPNNQARWLAEEFKKAKLAGRKVILALHHPLFTPGKRAFDNDIHLYLSKDEIQSNAFKQQFSGFLNGDNFSYNQLMRETLKQQNMTFDTILAAHDHDIYYYNNKDNNNESNDQICQVTSGGGGGGLHKRESFDEQNHMGCFLKRYGVTDVHCPVNGPIDFFIHTIPNSNDDKSFHLHFNSNHCEPICTYPTAFSNTEIQAIKKFRMTIITSINEYLGEFLGPRQSRDKGKFLGSTPWSGNTSHGQSGVERAHVVWAYINSQVSDSYSDTIKNVYMMSRWTAALTNPTDHSFITILNNNIASTYGNAETMKSMYERVVTIENNGKRLSLEFQFL